MRHPCMTFWPEKFFADTADMSGDGAAIYLILLAHAWVRGGSLPNDIDKLRLMTRLPKMRWAHIQGEVMQKWSVGEDGRLHQKRLDTEWALAERRQGMASAVHVAAHKEAEAKTQNRKKPRANASREVAKNPMISTRARADYPTPTPTEKNSALQAESSSLAPASLSVRAHASPSLRVITNTELPIPPDEQARVAEGLARLKLELQQSAAALEAQDIHNRRS